MSLYQNHNNKRENFTVSCIQIGFNASKDIQEWMATVNLNLLTWEKPNITSILFILTQVWQDCENTYKDRQVEIYKINQENKIKKGSVNAGCGNLQWKKKMSFFILLSAVNSRVLQRRTGRVQVTHLKFCCWFFCFLEKANLCMKGCKKRKRRRRNSSVVDTSGHKHRECILWTKSIITKEGKTSKSKIPWG